MFDFFWNLISFVIALGILVTVHEYGHYWVARKCGVHVHRFSVGFGKALWRKTDKHGTEFVVAAIPLGGYVKMLDERVEEVAEQDLDKAFNRKPVVQRIAIIAAGPLANFIFAIFAFYLMYLIGVPSVKPIIAELKPQSVIAQANIPNNSELVSVAGQKVQSWQDVNIALVSQIGESNISVEVKLPESSRVKSFQLDTRQWQFQPEQGNAITDIGIVPLTPKVHAEIGQIGKNSPASQSDLMVGDKLLAVNNERVNGDWVRFSQIVKQYPNQQVELLVERQGLEQVIAVAVGARESKEGSQGYLGIAPKVDQLPSQYQTEIRYGVIESVGVGVEKTWDLIVFSFQMIGKLITGDVSLKNLSGPISIAQGAGASAGFGIIAFLSFLALISINLGIINLLPLPVLDGGHLLYYVIELFTGKPVPEHIQETGFKFGALALLTLMSIALFNDISRL
ncbi:sigma E protease regulator RseP [Endozoicomonas sp. G2_1]|uniref:sigma E protease regulator RseP n=1 Tax=Endozoicomonas sp. G2_1 TaxID=2821091 RepID=UPI001ADA5027|nr:sigma E protease regulator RseP [Endozoicomonas sp. G2_1]MBO9492150.1 sigma E protease regulator RseP [Endozoicomonas sp. G2_1]